MDRALIVLSGLAACLFLSQWYVFFCIRNYLFARQEPITRKVAYPVLAALGFLNYGFVKIALGSSLFAANSVAQKAAAVVYFSYLGAVLLACLFLSLVALGSSMFTAKHPIIGVDRTAESVAQPAGCRAGVPTSDGNATGNDSGEQLLMPFPAGCRTGSTPTPENHKPPDLDGHARSAAGNPPDPSRRAFLKWGSAAGLTTAVVLAGHGVVRAYGRPLIDEFDVSHPALKHLERPVSFIHITDFHIGMFFGLEELEKIVERVNAIEADALFITGDIFHSPLSPIEETVPILKRLRPRRYGNFAVLGNHDFYAGERRSVEAIEQSGLTLLRDEWITFTEGRTRIHLGGIDDPIENWITGKNFPGFRDFVGTIPGMDGMRILLSHRPTILPYAAETSIDLVLAGHIHGGQIIVPVPGTDRGVSLAALVSPFTHGWYRARDCRMYLSRGIGLTFVPWRINCPPEITVFRLRPPGTRSDETKRPAVRDVLKRRNAPAIV